MGILEDLQAETNPKTRAGLKARYMRQEIIANWNTHRILVDGNRRIELTEEPLPVYDKDGNEVGIEFHIRAFEQEQEINVDPVRRFINPPISVVIAEKVVDRSTRPPILISPRITKVDTIAVLKHILFEQVFP